MVTFTLMFTPPQLFHDSKTYMIDLFLRMRKHAKTSESLCYIITGGHLCQLIIKEIIEKFYKTVKMHCRKDPGPRPLSRRCLAAHRARHISLNSVKKAAPESSETAFHILIYL